LGPREKLLGRAAFYREIFFPKLENGFKTGFSSVLNPRFFTRKELTNPKKLPKFKLLKNPPKPFGTKRKVLVLEWTGF
jgi:hypothetical protein